MFVHRYIRVHLTIHEMKTSRLTGRRRLFELFHKMFSFHILLIDTYSYIRTYRTSFIEFISSRKRIAYASMSTCPYVCSARLSHFIYNFFTGHFNETTKTTNKKNWNTKLKTACMQTDRQKGE